MYLLYSILLNLILKTKKMSTFDEISKESEP